MGNPQKRKGDKYEVDLAKWFNENIFNEERCQRAPLSGGGKIGLQAGGADILGTPDVFIEAKRVERLNVRDLKDWRHMYAALLEKRGFL